LTGETEREAGAAALPFLGAAPGAALPASFAAGVLVLPPGGAAAYDPETWRGALVVVRRGRVDVRTRHGVSRRFTAGDLLVLAGLGVERLVNPGPGPLELVALKRRAADP
jgi:ABC-type arginine transport system permease subunit